MTRTTILITGASRGLYALVLTQSKGSSNHVNVGPGSGASLAAKYLLRPNTTVIATVRDVTAGHEQRVLSFPRGQGSEPILLALDMQKASSAADGVARLRAEHDIRSLDLVVANAGVCESWGPVAEISEAELLSHVEVNTLGFLRLYKGTIPLLDAAKAPKLVYVSTDVASISQLSSESITTEDGISKKAGNFLIRMFSIEHKNLITFSISPGFVQTDMGNRGVTARGVEGTCDGR